MGRGGTHPREQRVRRRDVKSRKPENPENRRIGVDTVGKLTIYTANAGPTDLPECEKLKILKSAESAPPIAPPETYPPRPPRPPDSEKFESRGGLPPENRVRWVGGAHTRENGELAGEASNLESPKIRKIGKSVPPFAPPVRTPRGPHVTKPGKIG